MTNSNDNTSKDITFKGDIREGFDLLKKILYRYAIFLDALVQYINDGNSTRYQKHVGRACPAVPYNRETNLSEV